MLKQHVRSGNDPVLQKILKLLRKSNANDKEIKCVSDMIVKHCNFISSFDKAPKHALRIVARRETKQNVEKEHLEKIKNNKDILTVDCTSADEIQEGDTWKPLRNRKLVNQLNKCLIERENLTLFVGLVVCMSYNSNDQCPDFKFTQGQLAMIDEIPTPFIPLESAITITLVPPGERDILNVKPTWVKIKIKARESIPILMGSNYLHGRRRQYPFSYYMCSTIHKSVGQTLPAVAIQLSNKEKLQLWQKELFTVEISRTNALENVYVVGSKEEVPAVIDRIFKMDNAIIDNIVARVEALDVLRLSDSHPKSTEESLVNILSTTYTPPVFGFVYHAVFQDKPYFSYIDSTAKRIEIQIREDNSKEHLTVVGGSSCELCGFIHGFESEAERESILIMMSNQTQMNFRLHTHHSPWSIRDNMIRFVETYNEQCDSNLIYTKTGKLNEKLVFEKAEKDYVLLIEKKNHTQ